MVNIMSTENKEEVVTATTEEVVVGDSTVVENTPTETPAGETEETVEIPYLQMSDEEIENLSPADIETRTAKAEKPQETVAVAVKEQPAATTAEVQKPEKATESQKAVVNNDALVAEIFAPFKANGKEFKVDNVEDVRSLMQMGANYNKKMASLKPYLKVVKILENNGLLDEAKLNHLIDISRKDPKALAKAIADSGHDLMDLGSTEVADYRPSTYTVTDEEMALESVLSDIRGTASYKDTLTIVNTKWDSASRKAVLAQPETLRAINDHVSTGLYQNIMDIVDQERTLGRLTNLSDLEAYKQVGQVLHRAGAFNQPQSVSVPVKPVVATKQPSPQARAAKAAAGIPTKGAPTAKPAADFNPLNVSDAEFEKLFAQQQFR